MLHLNTFRVTEEVTARLLKSANHQIERDGILATRLCTHKDDVELTNDNKLKQLPGGILLFFLMSFFNGIKLKTAQAVLCCPLPVLDVGHL